MTQDEAEKLARLMRPQADTDSMTGIIRSSGDLRALCDHILSGDMRREIENAALRRAAEVAEAAGMDGSPSQIKQQVLALIQPPAQKEAQKCE